MDEDVNDFECTSISLIKNKKIKKWSFYDQHKLCLFECHTDINDDKIIQQKFYLNNTCVDVQELPSLNIINHISKLQIILKEHDEFINDVNKYLNKLSFNHSLKYGWKRKDLSFSLTVYKYKNIECILHFKQKEYILNKEETLLFLQNPEFLQVCKNKELEKECDPVVYRAELNRDQESFINNFNNLSLNNNEPVLPEQKHNDHNVNDLVNSIQNLNLKEQESRSCHEKKKHNYDFLFINYPKWKRIEYQSCKRYDTEEIEFNKYNYEEM